MKSPQPHILNYDFVKIELFSNYLIATFAEGILFDGSHLDIMYKVFDQYYPNKKFGYISNRVYDYTVDPNCYKDSGKYPLLMGIAVCCYSEASFKMAEFEKAFFVKPFAVFYSLEESEAWVKSLLPQDAKKTVSQ